MVGWGFGFLGLASCYGSLVLVLVLVLLVLVFVSVVFVVMDVSRGVRAMACSSVCSPMIGRDGRARFRRSADRLSHPVVGRGLPVQKALD